MSNEQRRAPRFSHQMEVDLDGSELFTSNLSMTGAQLTCHPMSMFALRTKLQQTPVTLKLLPSDLPAIPVKARVVYINESDDEVLVGVAFEPLEGTHAHVFRHYIKAVAGEDFVNY